MAGGVCSVLSSCVGTFSRLTTLFYRGFMTFCTINEFNYSSSQSSCHLECDLVTVV